MRKYEDVDIIAALGAVLEINTEHYRSDFRYDIESFQKAATQPDGDNNHLIWLSRLSGTECFPERNTLIRGISAFNTCNYYANSQDSIHAYAVEITGAKGGKPMGNLFELDLREYAARILRDAQPPTHITLSLENGTKKQITYEQYDKNWTSVLNEFGPVAMRRYEVADERGLQQLLIAQRSIRQHHTPAVFKLRIHNPKPSIREQLATAKSAVPARHPAEQKMEPSR